MELTDEQWMRVFRAAEREAQRRLRNPIVAEDVAAIAVEKMLKASAVVPDDGLEAYVVTVVRNLLIDKHRGRAPTEPVEDDDLESGMAIFGLALHAKDPLAKMLKSERIRRRIDVARRILDSLNPRELALVELTLAGASGAEIADELGYASAAVVRTTRNRIYQRLQRGFARDVTPSLFHTTDS